MDYIEGFIAADRRKEMKSSLEALFADPALVSRDMVNEILKYKRLDGVTAALRTLADAAFAGGRQVAVMTNRLGELTAPSQVICGTADRIVSALEAALTPVLEPYPLHLVRRGSIVGLSPQDPAPRAPVHA